MKTRDIVLQHFLNVLPSDDLLMKIVKDPATGEMIDVIGISAKTRPALAIPTPTHYVDFANGRDHYAGSEVAPWKNLYHALGAVSADAIISVLAPATNPMRRNLLSVATNGLTIFGAGNQRQYLLGSIDVSSGATVENALIDGGVESWTSGGVPSQWGVTPATGTITQELTEVNTPGGSSVKFVRSAGTQIIADVFTLEAGVEYQFRFAHKSPTSTRFRYTLRDIGGGVDLVADGSWAASPQNYVDDVASSLGVWKLYTKNFTPQNSGPFYLSVNYAFTGTAYLGELSILPTSQTTRAWTVYSGDTYMLPIGNTVKRIAVCTKTAWTASGCEALGNRSKGADKDTLAAGQWIYDAFVLYYRLVEGESIADLHIEASRDYYDNIATYTVSNNGVSIPADNITVNHLLVGLSNGHGLHVTSAATGCTLNNVIGFCTGENNSKNTFMLEGAATLNQCTSQYGGTKGFLASGAGASVVQNNCLSYRDWGGGFYSLGATKDEANFCVAAYTGVGGEETDDNSGFLAHAEAASNLALNKCASFYCYGRGVGVDGSGTVSVYNHLSFGTILSAASDAKRFAGFTGTFTHGNNRFGSYSAEWSAGETEITADPLMVDPANGDYRLSAASPCIGAGGDRFAGGAVDQYDADGYMVWHAGLNAPVYHELNGVDIGPHTYGGSSKVYHSLTVSNSWPAFPALYDVIGKTNAVYNADGTSIAFDTPALALAALASLADDQYLWGGTKQAALYPTDMSAQAARIKRAVGDTT